MRKEDHVTDGRTVGEDHHQPIDADPFTRGRGHAVLQGADVIVVHDVRLGVAAGTLGLESYPGFIFYLVASFLVSVLLFALKAEAQPAKYYYRPLGDMWLGDVFGGLSGFVLTWTLFYGLVRA